MALTLPNQLVHLEANCGVYALWVLFQHHGLDVQIDELIQATQHDQNEGTFTIALAVALKKFGFEVQFCSDPDLNIDAKEQQIYQQARNLNIPILPALTYAQIQQHIEQGQFVIVYYDSLDGIGNQSLIYSIDAQEVCFFDSFEPMAATIFEQQRQAEGICRQAIVIDDRHFEMRTLSFN